MDPDLMSWQDRDCIVVGMYNDMVTYNDLSRGDLHVGAVGFRSRIRNEELRTVKHARVCVSIIVQPFEHRLGELGEKTRQSRIGTCED